MKCIFRTVVIVSLASLIHGKWEIGRKTLDRVWGIHNRFGRPGCDPSFGSRGMKV